MESKEGKMWGGGISDSGGLKWWRPSQEKDAIALWEEENESADHTTIWHFAFPSCLPLQEADHLHSDTVPPSFSTTYIHSIISLLQALFFFPLFHLSYRCSRCRLFPSDTQPKLTSGVHTASAYYWLVPAWPLLPTADCETLGPPENKTVLCVFIHYLCTCVNVHHEGIETKRVQLPIALFFFFCHFTDLLL